MVEDSSKEVPAESIVEALSMPEPPPTTTSEPPSNKTLEDLRSRALQSLGTKKKASTTPAEGPTLNREDGELTDEEGQISDPAVSDISEDSLIGREWTADETAAAGPDYLAPPSYVQYPFGAAGPFPQPMAMRPPMLPPLGHVALHTPPVGNASYYGHSSSPAMPPNPNWFGSMPPRPLGFPHAGYEMQQPVRPWGEHHLVGVEQRGPPSHPYHPPLGMVHHEQLSRPPAMPVPNTQFDVRPHHDELYSRNPQVPSQTPREDAKASANQPEDEDSGKPADGDVIMDETDLVVESVEDMNHMHPTTPSKGPASSGRVIAETEFVLSESEKHHSTAFAESEPKKLRRTQSSPPPSKLCGSPKPITKTSSLLPPRPAAKKPPIQTKLTIVYGEDDSSDDDDEHFGLDSDRLPTLQTTIMEMKATVEKAEAKKKASISAQVTSSGGTSTPPVVKSANATREELKELKMKLADMERELEQKRQQLDSGSIRKPEDLVDASPSKIETKTETSGHKRKKAADYMDDEVDAVNEADRSVRDAENSDGHGVSNELVAIKDVVKTLQEQLNKDRNAVSEVQELITKSKKSLETHTTQVKILTSRRNALRASLELAESKLQNSEALAAEQAHITTLLEKRLVDLKAVSKKTSLELEKQLGLAAATAKEARIGLLHHGNKGLLASQLEADETQQRSIVGEENVISVGKLAQEPNSVRNGGDNPLAHGESPLASHGLYKFSPLKMLKCFRLSPLFYSFWRYNSESITFSNKIDPQKELCRFELHGACNDESCSKQHERDYRMMEAEIIQDICRYWKGGAPETPNSVHEAIEWIQRNIRESKLSSFLQMSRTESRHSKSPISRKKEKGKSKKIPKSLKKAKAKSSTTSPTQDALLSAANAPQEAEDEITRNDAFVPMYEVASDIKAAEDHANVGTDRYFSGRASSAFEHFEAAIAGPDSNADMFLDYIAALEQDPSVEKEVIVNILVRGIENHPDNEQLWLMYLPRYQSIVPPLDFAKMCYSARQRLGAGCMPLLRLWLGAYKSIQDIELVYRDVLKQEVADLVKLGVGQGSSMQTFMREKCELCLAELILWRAKLLCNVEHPKSDGYSGTRSFEWLCEVVGIHVEAASGFLSGPIVPSLLNGERALLLIYSLFHCATTGYVPSLDVVFGVVRHGKIPKYECWGKASSHLKRLHTVENHFKPRSLKLDGLESGVVAVTAAIIEMELTLGIPSKSLKHTRTLSSRYMAGYENGPEKCPLMWLKIAKAEHTAMNSDNMFKAYERAIESCTERRWWLMYHHYCAAKGNVQDNSRAVALLIGASMSSITLKEDIVVFCESCESALGRGPLVEDVVDLDFDPDMIGNYAVLLHALQSSEEFKDVPLKHFDWRGVFEYALSLTGSKSKGRILWERYLSLLDGMESLSLLARAMKDSTGYCPGEKILEEDWWFDDLVYGHMKGHLPQRRYELCVRLSKVSPLPSKAVLVLLLETALEVSDSGAIESHLSEARRFFVLPSSVWRKVIAWSRKHSKEATVQHFRNAVRDNLYDVSIWHEFVMFVVQENHHDEHDFVEIAQELRVQLQDMNISEDLVKILGA